MAPDEVIPEARHEETVELILEVQEREDVLSAVVHVPAEQLLDQVQLARLVSSPQTVQPARLNSVGMFIEEMVAVRSQQSQTAMLQERAEQEDYKRWQQYNQETLLL